MAKNVTLIINFKENQPSGKSGGVMQCIVSALSRTPFNKIIIILLFLGYDYNLMI